MVRGESVVIDVAGRVRRIINQALTDVSLILSPNMDPATRGPMISHLAGSIERIHGKKISLTGLLHCLDLLTNAQPPFEDVKLFGFDARGITQAIHAYVVEQRKQIGMGQPSDEVAMSLSERSLAFAHALKANPEMDRKFQQLFKKIQARVEESEAKAQNGRPKQYISLLDYLQAARRMDVDQVDEILGVIASDWTEEVGISRQEYMRQRAGDLLYEINAFGHSDDLEAILEKQKV